MRYDVKNDRIEMSVGELCRAGRGQTPERDGAGADAIDTFLPELRAGGGVREIEVNEENGGISYLIRGCADAVVCADELRVSEVIFEEGGDDSAKIPSGEGDASAVGVENTPDAGSGSAEAGKSKKTAPRKVPPPPGERLSCLAYMFCLREEREGAALESVVLDISTGEIRRRVTLKKRADLEAVWRRCLGRRAGEAAMLAERGRRILPGAAGVVFPYPRLRGGQEEMMRECYDALRSGGRLFVQAPTGIGKTVSSLYPAVKFLGQGRCEKIFYLTSRTVAQREAYKAAGLLHDGGARLRTLVLASKDSCCLMRGRRPKDMPCGRFACRNSGAPEERIRAAVCHLLALQNGYEPKIIAGAARKFCVCPYELSLELSEYCEIIIADCNYAFDPLVRMRRYFDNPDYTGRCVFLIDEAHNLADRARSMYSAEIKSSDLARLRRLAGKSETPLAFAVKAASEELSRLRRLCRDSLTRGEDGVERGYYTSRELPEGLVTSLGILARECEYAVWKGGDEEIAAEAASLSRALTRYLAAANSFDESFLFYCDTVGRERRAAIHCLDPSAILEEGLGRADASVMFSATLTPIDYFADILGGGKRSRSLDLDSPFDPANLFIAAATDVSTRLEDREGTLGRIVSYIAAAVSGRRGNYIAYFPSYKYMESAADLFARRYPSVTLVVQRQCMSRAEREAFLAEFVRGDGVMRVGFCVLGGGFSEGIDLPGSSLIGVAIVGVGTPGISSERNIIRDYYEVSRGMGYDYAYTYPGMNNVLQAVGRVIRDEGDRGVALLIDDRYAEPKYASMYPRSWQSMQYFTSPASLNAAVVDFWNQKDPKMQK